MFFFSLLQFSQYEMRIFFLNSYQKYSFLNEYCQTNKNEYNLLILKRIKSNILILLEAYPWMPNAHWTDFQIIANKPDSHRDPVIVFISNFSINNISWISPLNESSFVFPWKCTTFSKEEEDLWMAFCNSFLACLNKTKSVLCVSHIILFCLRYNVITAGFLRLLTPLFPLYTKEAMFIDLWSLRLKGEKLAYTHWRHF